MAENGTSEYRLAALEREIANMRELDKKQEVMNVNIANLNTKVSEVSDGVKTLRTAVMGAAITIMTSAVGFIITALALFG